MPPNQDYCAEYRMKRFTFFAVGIVVQLALIQAYACDLPQPLTNLNIPEIPQSVINIYCNPIEPFEHILFIRSAVRVQKPVYRIIAVKRDINEVVTEVKLFQFSSDGTPHPKHSGQNQDEILFRANGRGFEAEVKGIKTTISFTESTFQIERLYTTAMAQS
ncbi:hypothetical protein C2W62_11045 [Candidatus Entotheonella serta]|nr:hypothetical protein C2W62_11045 [Candidatus Entotheonella serta]